MRSLGRLNSVSGPSCGAARVIDAPTGNISGASEGLNDKTGSASVFFEDMADTTPRGKFIKLAPNAESRAALMFGSVGEGGVGNGLSPVGFRAVADPPS
jgi:hypothetical protein